MTEHTDPVFCTECQAAVRLERSDNDQLYLTCACGEQRPLRVSQVLPVGWER